MKLYELSWSAFEIISLLPRHKVSPVNYFHLKQLDTALFAVSRRENRKDNQVSIASHNRFSGQELIPLSLRAS